MEKKICFEQKQQSSNPRVLFEVKWVLQSVLQANYGTELPWQKDVSFLEYHANTLSSHLSDGRFQAVVFCSGLAFKTASNTSIAAAGMRVPAWVKRIKWTKTWNNFYSEKCKLGKKFLVLLTRVELMSSNHRATWDSWELRPLNLVDVSNFLNADRWC